MEKITVQIQKLHDDLVIRIGEVEAVKVTLLNEQNLLTKKVADADTRAKDINAREIAVRGIEDVQALSNETAELKKKIDADNQELVIKRTAFENYQVQFKDESAGLTSKLNAGIEANKAKEALLTEQEKQLKEKEKNLRAKIIEDINKNLK